MNNGRVDLNLFPSILYKDIFYTSDIEKKHSAIVELYEKVFSKIDNFRLLLIGNSSIGKSTSAKTLAVYFLSHSISYYLVKLQELNYNKFALEKFKEMYDHLNTGTILIIDGYDELYDNETKKYFESIISEDKKNISKIVISRYEHFKKDGNNKRKSLFPNYEKVEMQQLAEEQIDYALLKAGIDLNNVVIIKPLLKTTMFLKLYLEIFDKNKDDINKLNCVKDEVFLLQYYFDVLFKDKKNNKKSDIYLRDIGNICYNNYKNIASSKKADIPSEMNGIYTQLVSKKYGFKIKTTHNKYMHFAIAKYITRRLIDLHDQYGNKIKEIDIKSLLCDMNPTLLSDREIMYYIGKMLFYEKQGSQLIKTLNEVYRKRVDTIYANVLLIFISYNNGKIDDEQINEIFDVGNKFLDVCSEYDLFCGNTYIKSINSRCLKRLYKYKSGIGYNMQFLIFLLSPLITLFKSLARWISEIFLHKKLSNRRGQLLFDENCKLELIIDNRAKKIRKYAFDALSCNITKVFIGRNVGAIGYGAFGWFRPNLNLIEVDSNNKKYYVKSNCLIDRNSKKIILCGSDAVVPNDGSVNIIDVGALGSCSKIRIPNNIEVKYQRCFLGINNNGCYAFNLNLFDPAYHENNQWIARYDLWTIINATIYKKGNESLGYGEIRKLWLMDYVLKDNTIYESGKYISRKSRQHLLMPYQAEVENGGRLWKPRFENANSEIKHIQKKFETGFGSTNFKTSTKACAIIFVCFLLILSIMTTIYFYNVIEIIMANSSLVSITSTGRRIISLDATCYDKFLLLQKYMKTAIYSLMIAFIVIILLVRFLIYRKCKIKFSDYYKIQLWIYKTYGIETYIDLSQFPNAKIF